MTKDVAFLRHQAQRQRAQIEIWNELWRRRTVSLMTLKYISEGN